MGFGVFRRRPDYERRARRIPLVVAAAVATVGPTLFVRPQPPRAEKTRFEYYQRRRALPTSVTAAAATIGPTLRLRAQPRFEAKRFEPYRRRLLLPTVPAASVPTAGWTLRAKHPLPQVRIVRFEPYYEKLRLPTTPFVAPTGVTNVLRPRLCALPYAYVRPWDYARATGRKVIKPRLPGAVVAVALESASRGHYAGGQGWYHTEKPGSSEPYCLATTVNAQSIPTATWTELEFAPTTTPASFSGADADPWSMVNVADSKVVIGHDGWYNVTLVIDNFEVTGVNTCEAKVLVYDAAGGPLRTTIDQTAEVSTLGAGTHFVASKFDAFAEGFYLKIQVYHASGANVNIGPCSLSVVRVALPTTILPT